VALACELAEACEANGSGLFPHTRFLIAQYLRIHPRGRHRDRLEWMNARLAMRREHGGDPLAGVESLRRFLLTHSRSTCRAEIRLAMARLYRIAGEWLAASGDPERLAGRCFRRARYLYRALQQSTDPVISQTAQVCLFELEQAA